MAKPARKGPPAAAPRKPLAKAGDHERAILALFPHELRPGDQVIGRDGKVWEVAAPPTVYLEGKMQTIRLRTPGERSVTSVEHLAAHERVQVRRG